ncbi:hypothetical protein B0T16DRAFT_393671 [Cercophora newfieldiana]|uniref:Uncharacterized protein n=1 Tax=Cercophora newfieldiana TaxID=92897 RepID=A0AA39XXH0_9PEZI|nr:hypothetical protein B0T16DRAFT_393671 [Cercophora newfieldiana]
MQPILFSTAFLATLAMAAPNSIPKALDERQGACGPWTITTRLEGDGDPWQAPFPQENHSCGDGTCTICKTDSESFTIGFSATGGNGWIDGGFAVEMSVETGEPGEEICIWKAVGRTAYKARDYMMNQCNSGEPAGDVFEIVSPNTNNVDGDFYCVRGPCRNKGDSYEAERYQGGPGTEPPAK